jgi:hypothetical protein
MKKWIASLAAVAVSFAGAFASAEEVKSGLDAGAAIPAFIVAKVGGANEDGVEVGKELCYRCKYGARPQVMIFTRTTSGEVANLTKELNAAVAANADKQLSAFVNVMSADKAAAEKAAKELAAAGSANVPVVVPVENENGPANYGINPDAEVTVLIANKMKVVSTHGYKAGQFNADAVKAIVAEVNAAVK